MFDEKGILAARAKEVKLRLLDTVKIKNERSFWQFINVLLPISLLGLGALFFNILRKRKFAS